MSMKSILNTISKSFTAQLKAKALTCILAAEKTLPGATGAEKRAYVVRQLDDLITLPWYLESLDGPAIGALVDVICNKLNLLTDHDMTAVVGEEDKAVVAIEATEAELTEEKSVEEKLEELYRKYKV